MSKKYGNPIDSFFDFLGDLVTPRTGHRTSDGSTSERPSFRTAEEREAWEELNDYMNDGRTRKGPGGTAHGASAGPDSRTASSLDQDYSNLEVPVGTEFSLVKASYKRLLREYHPDRHSGNPEKQRIATEITQKLNASYQRIKTHAEGGPPH
jgi:DnaJ-domain-containing protein 1